MYFCFTLSHQLCMSTSIPDIFKPLIISINIINYLYYYYEQCPCFWSVVVVVVVQQWWCSSRSSSSSISSSSIYTHVAELCVCVLRSRETQRGPEPRLTLLWISVRLLWSVTAPSGCEDPTTSWCAHHRLSRIRSVPPSATARERASKVSLSLAFHPGGQRLPYSVCCVIGSISEPYCLTCVLTLRAIL